MAKNNRKKQAIKKSKSLKSKNKSINYIWKGNNINKNFSNKFTKHAKIFHIRYGNLVLVIIGIIASIWLIYNPEILISLTVKEEFGYLSAFILGLIYPTGVTTAASIVGFYIIGNTLNPYLLAIVGSIGAIITDFLIFHFIRHKLLDYFDKFANKFSKISINIWRYKVNNHKYLKHLVPLFAGFLIASPIPTEIAIGIFAAIKFKMKWFLLYAFLFHALSIFVIVQLGAYNIF